MKADSIFARLWEQYTAENPGAGAIYQLFKNKGEQVVNDHVAFRTFDDPRVNIDVLAKPSRLVLDDLGVEYADDKGSFRVDFDELMDMRWKSNSATLITTNLNQGDFQKRADKTSAVDHRRFIKFLIDSLQPSQKDDHVKTNVFPEHHTCNSRKSSVIPPNHHAGRWPINLKQSRFPPF